MKCKQKKLDVSAMNSERKLRCCSEPKFYFVKTIGNKIVELNSGPFTGKVVKHVSKQGPLYIRATAEVHDESLKRWYGSNC